MCWNHTVEVTWCVDKELILLAQCNDAGYQAVDENE